MLRKVYNFQTNVNYINGGAGGIAGISTRCSFQEAYVDATISNVGVASSFGYVSGAGGITGTWLGAEAPKNYGDAAPGATAEGKYYDEWNYSALLATANISAWENVSFDLSKFKLRAYTMRKSAFYGSIAQNPSGYSNGAGGLAGSAGSNVAVVDSLVEATITNGSADAGGLFGGAYGNENYMGIINNKFTGSVTSSTTNGDAGGITGIATNAYMERNSVTGTLRGTYVGGLSARSYYSANIFRDNKVDALLSSTSSTYPAGGLVSWHSGLTFLFKQIWYTFESSDTYLGTNSFHIQPNSTAVAGAIGKTTLDSNPPGTVRIQ